MLRNHTLLSILCATALLTSLLNIAVLPVAKAIPPPGTVEKMMENSPEALVIEVVSVNQSVKQDEHFDEFIKRRRRHITVAAEVKVLRVERSKTRLKKDDRIVIKYIIMHPDDTAGITGSLPPIIIKQDSVYEALVRSSDDKKELVNSYGYREASVLSSDGRIFYHPAALQSSFIQVNNGRGKTLQSCN
jgi:hypothetical protein